MKNRFSSFLFDEKGDNLINAGLVIIISIMGIDAWSEFFSGLYIKSITFIFILTAVIYFIIQWVEYKEIFYCANEQENGEKSHNKGVTIFLKWCSIFLFSAIWCFILFEPFFMGGNKHFINGTPFIYIYDVWIIMTLSFFCKSQQLKTDPKRVFYVFLIFSISVCQSLVHLPFLFTGFLVFILFSDFVKSRRVIEALSRMSGTKRDTSISTAMVLCDQDVTDTHFQNSSKFDSVVLTRLAKKLGSSSSLKRQVLSFLDELRQVFAIDSTALWIFGQNRTLEFVITKGSNVESAPGLRNYSEVAESLLNLFSKGNYKVLDYSGYPELKIADGYDKALFIPVNAAGTTIALLQIEGEPAFGKWDIKLLENLVDQIAINVLNSRISEQVSRISVDLEKREFDYSAMNLLGRITGHTQDVVKIVEFTMAMLVRTLDLPCVAIQVINGNNLVLEHADGHICGQNYFYELWDEDSKVTTGKYEYEKGMKITELTDEKKLELYRSTGREVTALYEYSFSLRAGSWARIGFLSPPANDEKRNTEFIEFVIPQIKAALDSATVLSSLEQKAGVLKLIYSVCNAMDLGSDYRARIQGVVNVIAQYLKTDEFAIFVRKGETSRLQPFATESFDSKSMADHVESIFLRHLTRVKGDPLYMEPMDNLIDDKGLSDFLVTSLVHLGELTGFIVLRETPFSRVESNKRVGQGIKNSVEKVDLSLVKALAILTGQLAETYRMQDELKVLKEYLSNLMNSLGEAAIAFTSSGLVTSINSRSLSLFPDLIETLPEGNEGRSENSSSSAQKSGEENKKLSGRSIFDLFFEYREIKEFYETFLASEPGDGNELHRIYENRGLAGQRIFEIQVTAMDKMSDNFVSTIRDVTLSVQKEEDIKKIEHLAELGKMAAGIAHEIRNPIGGIKLISTYLQSEFEPDDEKYEMAETIIEGVTSLESKINSLLNYSKPAEPAFREESINGVISSALAMYRPEIENKKIELKIDDTMPQNIKVKTDSALLGQVIGNLLKNSIQAMEDSSEDLDQDRRKRLGLIEIKVFLDKNSESNEPDHAIIEILDSGHGMTEEELERAFEPFFTSKAQGTGLGLAVSKKIIQALKGSLVFSNREDAKGLCARLTIPLVQAV